MSLPVFANNLTATVLSVGDGDTIRVRTGNKTVTVRLACIDAPEIKQSPWGQQSSARLKQLLPVGQTITLRPVETDKYNRLVAEIYVAFRSAFSTRRYANGIAQTLSSIQPHSGQSQCTRAV